MPDAPREIEAAQLTDAYAMCLRLLGQGTEDDLAHGPRWRRLPEGQILLHLDAHLASVDNCLTHLDHQSRLLEAAHVAVRAMQLLQRAIEEDRDD